MPKQGTLFSQAWEKHWVGKFLVFNCYNKTSICQNTDINCLKKVHCWLGQSFTKPLPFPGDLTPQNFEYMYNPMGLKISNFLMGLYFRMGFKFERRGRGGGGELINWMEIVTTAQWPHSHILMMAGEGGGGGGSEEFSWIWNLSQTFTIFFFMYGFFWVYKRCWVFLDHEKTLGLFWVLHFLLVQIHK